MMMRKKKFSNKIGNAINNSPKISKPSEAGSILDLYPRFSLRFLQSNSKYCLRYCSMELKASFADKIRVLSQLTWREIIKSHRHANGYESIPQKQLNIYPPIALKNRKFIAFRFHNKHPMVGYIEYDTFYIVWFDHDFSLYDHG
jgi:hypothetical protein